MFTLRGIFPAPQKESKKNFIKENVRSLRNMQNNRIPVNNNTRVFHVKKEKAPAKVSASVFTNESIHKTNNSSSKGSIAQTAPKSQTSSNKVHYVLPAAKASETPLIRKADMNEFLRRKKIRDTKPIPIPTEYFVQSTDNLSNHKDVGCQYIDPDATHFFADGTKLRVMYPSKKVLDNLEKNIKERASHKPSSQDIGDTGKIERPIVVDRNSKLGLRKKEPVTSATKVVQSRYLSNCNLNGQQDQSQNTQRSTFSLNSPRKLDSNTISMEERNPLLPPPSYQKGVVPKYIKEIKQKKDQKRELSELDDFEEADAHCPAGHIALPESERIETLKILREKFSDLINELNKMPVRTDTLRMRNRKMVLDKELAKLEEGIKVFSRPRVYVNIDV